MEGSCSREEPARVRALLDESPETQKNRLRISASGQARGIVPRVPPNPLPFRRAPRPWRWWQVPVVSAAKLDAAPGHPRIYVCELGSRADARIICASLEAAGLPAPRWLPSPRAGADEEQVRAAFLAGEPVAVPLAPPPTGPDRLARLLAWAQRADVEVELVPVEVLWGPAVTRPRLRDLWLGDPFAPPRWLRWWHVRRRDSCRVIAAVPGLRSELESHAPRSLAAFVRARAVRALASQGREVFGERLKVARFVVEEVLAEPDFQDRVAAAGAQSGWTRAEALARAQSALRELATGHRRLALGIFSRLARWLAQLAFEPEVSLDPAQVAKLRELGRNASLVFVPSHQSNVDHLVMFHALNDAGFAPPFTAAGINLSFWPVSRLLRGTGAFFIRRSGEDPVYREALRAFVAYLLQRHFHLEFFIEGTRTRTGKLLPPRYGMLRYAAEAGGEPGASDVWFVPTSLTYDQVLEVGDYVRQQLGAERERESLRFVLRQIRRARRQRLGRIYLRFAEPLSLRVHRATHGAELLSLEKLAFAICTRINGARPLLPGAVLCSVLLASERRALTGAELEAQTERVIAYARERGLELGGELELGAAEAVGAALSALRATRIVASYTGGTEPVFYVPDERRHAASYYRNSILHCFLSRAIAQIAGSSERAAPFRALAAAGGKAEAEMHWALRLRELLKFEFFFRERDAFLADLEREREILAREQASGLGGFAAGGPRILADLLESYWVVTEALTAFPSDENPLPEAALLDRCHGLGRQLLLQQRIAHPEGLSSIAFSNALQLLANLGAADRTPAGLRIRDRTTLEHLASDLELLTALARSN
jgi:glycerol-3-phosphate O-acyltransferase